MENRGYVSLRKTHSIGKGLKSWQKEGTKADFDEPGCLETILCLILPGKCAGGPERGKAWFRVTQH